MQAGYFVKASLAAVTTGLAGPTLYDVCDPVLHDPPEGTGNAHLRKFYHTALRNAALRPLLARAGLPQLRDPARLGALRQALTAARDAPDPGAQDWRAIGAPVAALIDEFPQVHPQPPPAATGASAAVPLARIDVIIRACAARSAALVFPQRLHSGLRSVQSDRRPGYPRARSAYRADRPQRAQLSQCHAAVQSRPRLHPRQSGARRSSSIRPGAGSPSRCGSRCRSATARPITTLFLRKP